MSAVAAQCTSSHLVCWGAYHCAVEQKKHGSPPSPPARTEAPHPAPSVKKTARPMRGRRGALLGRGECRRAPTSLLRQPPAPQVPDTTTPFAQCALCPAVPDSVSGGAHRRYHHQRGPFRLGVDDARHGHGRYGGRRRCRRAPAARRHRERRRRRPRDARKRQISRPRWRWTRRRPAAAGTSHSKVVATAAAAAASTVAGPPNAAVAVAVPAAGACRGWRRAATDSVAITAAGAVAAAAAAGWWRRLGGTDGYQMPPECENRLVCACG